MWALMTAGRSEHLDVEGTCPSFCRISDPEPVCSKRLDYGLVDALDGIGRFLLQEGGTSRRP
jgi:hypothetical protein